jgi:glycerate dehydrogenase
MNIVWLEADSLIVPLPRPSFPHQWTEFPYTTATDTASRIANADIVILNKVKLGEEELAHAPKLKLVAITATGMDNVDVKACQARGVTVKNVVNYGPQSVAEHAFACLLQLVRRVPEWQAKVHDGSWSESRFFCMHTYPMRSLNEMTLGILGSGAIGQTLAGYGRGFGMKVLQIERRGAATVRDGYVGFEEGFATCDAISLHCPLNDDTRGLISDEVLGMMKPGSILINTARGALVQFDALKRALESGQLHGAALDVLEKEPPPKDHPMIQWQHPRCIVTPHIAWGTHQSQSNMARLVLKNLENFVSPVV